jgi:serine/threonine protein kinase
MEVDEPEPIAIRKKISAKDFRGFISPSRIDLPPSKTSVGTIEGKWRGMSVAVCELSPHSDNLALDDEFYSEIETLVYSKPSTHVARILGLVSQPEKPLLLITQYVSSTSLTDLLRSESSLRNSNALLRLLKDAAEGLLHLHSQGIIHASMAAHNILVDTSAPKALLTDFGLCKKFGKNPQQQKDRSIGIFFSIILNFFPYFLGTIIKNSLGST